MGAAIALDETFDHHRRMLDRLEHVRVCRADEFMAELELTFSSGVTIEWLTGLSVVLQTSFGPKLYWVTRTRDINDERTSWFVTFTRHYHLSPRDPRVPCAGYVTFLSGDLRRETPIVS